MDRPAPTVLLTCFDAFGGNAINASARATAAVERAELPSGVHLVRAELPTVFGVAQDALRRELERHTPDIVICVGQAGGRRGFAIERVAVNIDDAEIEDNAGAQPEDVRIEEHGPVAYWSTLPVKAIARALRSEDIPAEVSSSAGTFVCNHVFYGLMHSLAERPGVRGGFIHIPFVDEQAVGDLAAAPSLPLATLRRGLELAICTAWAAPS